MDKLEVVGWYRRAEKLPEPGHKFVALYDDGSGAWLGFAHDGGFIDADGHDHEQMPNCKWWAYLPTGFELCCEGWPEEGFTLPRHVAPLAPAQEEIERLTRERNEAQSAVEAWAEVCEGLEAHLEDRVAMKDYPNPEAYLSILRSSMGRVQRGSEQIRAARWSHLRSEREQTQRAEARALAAEAQVERMRDGIRSAINTLIELNPSNYTHDDVCEANQATVEVMLSLAALQEPRS